jgi:sterol desaturase/sphingolipid hydroxylase (fatty acid hydroxylase superfamily)
MTADAILGILTLMTYFGMMAAEAIWPARVFPAVPRWRLLGLAFLAVLMAFGVVTPMLIPVEWLAQHRLLDGTRLGVVGGVVVGLLVFELVNYFIHRAAHRYSFLWRWVHQTHHATQRIDVASSALFHPFELLLQNVLGLLLGAFVLGIEPLAAGILGYLAAFMGIFQHLNVRTPRFIALFIHRPEGHCIHHQLNVHAYNYGNITLWDRVFGTFKNPDSFEGRVGFAEKPLFSPLLLGRDVSGGLGDGVERRRATGAQADQVLV